MDNSVYWKDKVARAIRAKEHTIKMDKEHQKEIKHSIAESKVYDNFTFYRESKTLPVSICLDDIGSVEAIFKYHSGKTAVLNFASYKNPGSMFLNGSKAQEECLCHESCLYNVLSFFNDTYYEWNRQHKNQALYKHRSIYSPDVYFESNSKNILCDVITCAAPNKTTAVKYCGVSDEENKRELKERIEFVLDIACRNKVDTLILGAFGAGVFGQDATDVANMFMDYLVKYETLFKKVIFAVPTGNGNYEKFKRVMEEKKK